MASSGKALSLTITTLFLVFSVTISSVTLAQTSPSWNVQTVDANSLGYGEGFCPIAIDSANHPHITYSAPYYNSTVKYASYNGSIWSIQTVAEPGYAFSLVLDENDNPHLLYGGLGGLTYASWTGSNWTSQIVEPADYGVVALDSFGNPHVAYKDGYTLKYASWTGSNWNIQTIGTYQYMSDQISLALDANNTPYVFYNGNTPNGHYYYVNLKLAILQNSSWNIQDIATAGGYGNMVLDSKGFPNVIYKIDYPQFTGLSNSTLFYHASWNGTAWKTESVVSNISLAFNLRDGDGAFLSLDSHDYPHISYATSQGQVMYARWTGKAWNIQTARDDSPDLVDFCYLALDSNGNPHISYREGLAISGKRNIVYATTNDTTPTFTITPTSVPTQAKDFVGQNMILLAVIVAVLMTVIATLLLLFARHRKIPKA